MSIKEALKSQERQERANKIKGRVEEIREDASFYNEIIEGLVSPYSADLDSLSDSMDMLVRDIRAGRITNYGDLQLEMRCLALAHAMYKAAEGLGILGGQSDMARMAREQKFAEVYKKIQEGTIPDKKAQAEEHVWEEKQVEALFQRAYNTLAAKIKAANRVLEAIKKILTSRIVAREVFRKDLDDSLIPEELADTADLEPEGDDF